MTTQELHIGIDLELQSVNRQNKKGLLPQEKDWFLNREVLNYINNLSDNSSKKPNFQNTIKNLEDIEELVVVSSIKEVKGGKVILPSNSFRLISATAYCSDDCNVPVILSNKTKHITRFNVTINQNNLNTFQININSNTGVQTVFTLNDLPLNYINASEFNRQQFLLNKALQIKLKKKFNEILNDDVELYFNKYEQSFNDNSFILVSNKLVNNIIVTQNTTSVTYVTTKKFETEYNINSLHKVPVRIVKNEFNNLIEKSHLSGSSLNSVSAIYIDNHLQFNESTSVVVKAFKCIYVRNPTLIDLLLNSNSELNTDTLNKVVSNTVQFLKAVVTDANYQTFARENILTE
jgi:hypothetical protein